MMTEEKRKRALRKRTKAFAGGDCSFLRWVGSAKKAIAVLAKQLLRSGTSVGANYREASRPRSDADFIAKIELCAQEADETAYWHELLNEDCGISESLTQPLWNEADELIRIFVTMAKNTKKRRTQQK